MKVTESASKLDQLMLELENMQSVQRSNNTLAQQKLQNPVAQLSKSTPNISASKSDSKLPAMIQPSEKISIKLQGAELDAKNMQLLPTYSITSPPEKKLGGYSQMTRTQSKDELGRTAPNAPHEYAVGQDLDKVDYFDSMDFQNLSQVDDLLGELDVMIKTGRPSSRLSHILLASTDSSTPAIPRTTSHSKFKHEKKSKPESKETLLGSIDSIKNTQSYVPVAAALDPAFAAASSKESTRKTEIHQRVAMALAKLAQAQIQKTPVRIYVNDSSLFKTVNLTNFMTADTVAEMIVEKLSLESRSDCRWVLFELYNDLSLERPLRDWELVTNIIRSWERQTTNALLIRKYGYFFSLGVGAFSRPVHNMKGELYLEISTAKEIRQHFLQNADELNGALASTGFGGSQKDEYGNTGLKQLAVSGGSGFKKYYFELEPTSFSIVYYKKSNSSSTVLCTLFNCEIFTGLQVRRKAPTKFGFALKSKEKVEVYEDPAVFVYNFCAENAQELKEWVLTLRHLKGMAEKVSHPEWFESDNNYVVGVRHYTKETYLAEKNSGATTLVDQIPLIESQRIVLPLDPNKPENSGKKLIDLIPPRKGQ